MCDWRLRSSTAFGAEAFRARKAFLNNDRKRSIALVELLDIARVEGALAHPITNAPVPVLPKFLSVRACPTFFLLSAATLASASHLPRLCS